MKNSADLGGCYPPRTKTEVNKTLRDLQNSSYLKKAEFNKIYLSSFLGSFAISLFVYLLI